MPQKMLFIWDFTGKVVRESLCTASVRAEDAAEFRFWLKKDEYRESTISRYARIDFMECRNFSMSSNVKAPMFPIRKNLLPKDPMPA